MMLIDARRGTLEDIERALGSVPTKPAHPLIYADLEHAPDHEAARVAAQLVELARSLQGSHLKPVAMVIGRYSSHVRVVQEKKRC